MSSCVRLSFSPQHSSGMAKSSMLLDIVLEGGRLRGELAQELMRHRGCPKASEKNKEMRGAEILLYISKRAMADGSYERAAALCLQAVYTFENVCGALSTPALRSLAQLAEIYAGGGKSEQAGELRSTLLRLEQLRV